MRESSLRRRFGLLAVTLSVAAVFAFGGVATATTNHHSHKPVKKILELAGTWGGNYKGRTYSGSFTLNWTQLGTRLTGPLKLSNPAGKYNCTGTINGSGVQFGAVSVGAVYTGTVSSNGKSMSGTWKSPVDSGTWSATKS